MTEQEEKVLERLRAALSAHRIEVVRGLIEVDGLPVKTRWQAQEVFDNLRGPPGLDAAEELTQAVVEHLRFELGYTDNYFGLQYRIT